VELRPASTRTQLAVDTALAAAFSVLTLAELRLHWDDGYSAGAAAWNIPLLLAVTLPVALRRRAPRTALVVAFGAVVVPSFFVAHTLFFFGGLVPLALLVYSTARQVDRYAVAVLAAPAALLAVYPLRLPRFDAADVAFGCVLFGSAWGAGRLVRGLERQRLLLADALAAQIGEQAARERALLLDERARIARELHDVVAHAVSVMVVQAGAARFALGADEEEVRQRLLAVEQTGRTAVGDLRRLLDVLRTDDEGDRSGGPAGPQPGLDRLGDLVDGLQRAGLPVRMELSGLPADLPAALDVTAYRVVQEALTNVLKHSTGEWVQVRVRVGADDVVLEVTDGGPSRQDTVGGPSTGQGLVGMRERVALFGGRLEAGPEGRGWRVRAELPRTPADEPAGAEAAW
jgi:signal transduction histidine kinase